MTPGLPPPYEFAAPAGWRAVDFISDLHLSQTLPKTFDAWASHLRRTSADAVVMLGDVFELWVGDDGRRLPFEQRCVDVMADAASRRALAFMAGNRDFLVGTEMLRECGLMGLSDPTVFSAWGRRVLLSHGDILCLDDAPYQSFRAMVRNAEWQRDFLAKPLAERLAMAAAVRQRSREGEQRAFDGNADADLDVAAMVAWMHAAGAAEMVHGHTHRPGSELLAPGHKRHVLSDWDLDDADNPRAEVLRLTRDGFDRISRPEVVPGLLRRWRAWRDEAAVASKPIDDALWKRTLIRYPFLRRADAPDAAPLRRLTSLFLAQKEFAAAPGVRLTDDVAVAVAAQACLPVLQLGLSGYSGFLGIVLHPDIVVARRSITDATGVVHEYDEELAGEAVHGGPVMLSWRDVRGAGRSAADGYNVVIHEFAHVLDMAAGWSAQSALLQQEYVAFVRRVDAGEDTALDSYGAEAPEELFAVASEAFFVAPLGMRAEHPALYRELATLYRQDPAVDLATLPSRAGSPV